MTVPIIAIDLSVAAHLLHERLPESVYKNTDLYQSALQAQVCWLLSAEWLGDLKPDFYQMVFCCDTKPYWRTEYVRRPSIVAQQKPRRGMKKTVEQLKGLLKDSPGQNWSDWQQEADLIQNLALEAHYPYKGGRKLTEYSFSRLKKDLYKILEAKGQTLWGLQGYEADDVVACLTQVTDRPILMVTVDSDWLGLVSDRVSWFCMKGWPPRHRPDLAAINRWRTLVKKQKPLDSPRDIWADKVLHGDKSDNLPAGTPLEVFDLLSPPKEYNLVPKPFGAALYAAMRVPEATYVPPEAVQRAASWLQKAGLRRFIDTYEA